MKVFDRCRNGLGRSVRILLYNRRKSTWRGRNEKKLRRPQVHAFLFSLLYHTLRQHLSALCGRILVFSGQAECAAAAHFLRSKTAGDSASVSTPLFRISVELSLRGVCLSRRSEATSLSYQDKHT